MNKFLSEPTDDAATANETTKRMNGWQVFMGERADDLREEGLDFGQASKQLKQEWRAMTTEERQAYNEVGKGV